ncbi:MAG: glycine cleavage system aminomethyltransferase GcvT [Spirochaetota bacterium]
MLRKTPLHALHVASGARMVDFAGWEMPLSYPGGPIEEHRLVRRSAGLFDVSHMGRFELSGPRARSDLQRIVSADIDGLKPNTSTYALLCRHDGGVLDDLFIYRLSRGDSPVFLVVANAANRDKDHAWIREHLRSAELRDVSDETSMLAFQGPGALLVMDRLTAGAASKTPRFGAAELRISDLPSPVSHATMTVGRTGYTGEDGVELFVPAQMAPAVWERILSEAEAAGVEAGPVGLAARDSLRFEPGFPLYGHELTEEITPLEARLTWACDLDKEFIGRDAIRERVDRGLETKLATVTMTERGLPRQGYRVLKDGEPVGLVATGMYAPTVDAFCANVFVPPALAKVGVDVDIEIRGRTKRAVVVKRPLYKPAYR